MNLTGAGTRRKRSMRSRYSSLSTDVPSQTLRRVGEPNIAQGRKVGALKRRQHQVRSFRQYLKRVPVCRLHHTPDTADDLWFDRVLEQIRHRIDKYSKRLLPSQRGGDRMLIEVHSSRPHMALTRFSRRPRVLCHPHSLEARCHALRVAVGATWRNHRASGHRIPSRLCPLDVAQCHSTHAFTAQRASLRANSLTLGEGFALAKHNKYMAWPLLFVSDTPRSMTTGKIVCSRLRTNCSSLSSPTSLMRVFIGSSRRSVVSSSR
jgi:hypothetical protein